MSAEHRTSAWAKASKRARPRLQAIIDAGSGWCFDGSHHLPPGVPWDVSHIVSVAEMKAAGASEVEWNADSNLVASCRRHNRRAGSALGARATNRKRAREAGRVDEW